MRIQILTGAAVLVLLASVGGAEVSSTGAIKSDYIGQTWSPRGDTIEITSVERAGGHMTVKGRYHLVSKKQADLSLFITTSTPGATSPDSRQTVKIVKGDGEFTLTHDHLVPGLPHVSMYSSGDPFAAVYFGTEAEGKEEQRAHWIGK